MLFSGTSFLTDIFILTETVITVQRFFSMTLNVFCFVMFWQMKLYLFFLANVMISVSKQIKTQSVNNTLQKFQKA